jgi:uncharacterized membrane protein
MGVEDVMNVRGKGLIGGLLAAAGMIYLFRPARRTPQPAGGVRRAEPVPARRYGSRLGDIPGLDTATLETGAESRGPSLALALRLVGGALLLYSMARRGRLALVSRTIGAGLLARGKLPGGEAARAIAPGAGERRRVVDIQKTLHIEAPVDQVYNFWGSYENFPLFMSNVREVENLGGGRSRWSVRGPGGAPIHWTAQLTDLVPNESIAWRSEPGAMLDNAGVIRFQPDGTGTRLDLRFCYRPPAGGAGQAVAELLGADPRAKLNEDLGRLKALLEATIRSES